MTIRFDYIPAASNLHNTESINTLVKEFSWALEKLGGNQITPDEISNHRPLVYFIITGGTERAIVDLWEKRKLLFPDEPVLMIAHAGHNSLPAAMEVFARLKQSGAAGRIIYLQDQDDDAGMELLNEAIRDLEVKRYLEESRIGRIGTPAKWLVASDPDPVTVRESWGPEVVDISDAELHDAMRGVSEKRVREIAEHIAGKAAEMVEPADSDMRDALRVYAGLSALIEKYRLSGITIRCWDLIRDSSVSACLALSMLNDEGTIAGCEGDMVSTLGMLWVYRLLGSVSWMANPVRVDPSENIIRLAHCSVPLSLVSGYRLRSHFESGISVAVEGELLEGPVTLIRIGGKYLEKVWIAEGESVQSVGNEVSCRTQLSVKLYEERSVAGLLENPLGNHLVLIPGLHKERLLSWWKSVRR